MEEEQPIEEPTKKQKKPIKLTKKHWQISTIVLVILFIISIITAGFHFGVSVNTVKSTIEELSGATVLNIETENGLYKATVEDENGNEGLLYMSKDGVLLFQGAIDVEKLKEYIESVESMGDVTGSATQEEPVEYPKTEKPEIDLFVMSFCPFGLQAQQLMLPVMELLKDKADVTIKFVSYIMHDKKEIDENTNQYCIQKEQPGKFIDYLKCFVGSKDSEACQKTIDIDTNKLKDCVESTDKEFKITELYEDKSTWLNNQFPLYNIHKEDNEKYNVRGSPTIVINGVEYSGSRSSEAYKQAICSSFTEAPEECEQKLTTTTVADDQC